MIRSRPFRRWAGTLAGCALVSACATHGYVVTAPPQPLPCPSAAFFGTPDTITATGAQQTVNLPGGHAVAFETGAVPAGTRFVVSRADTATASLDVHPVTPVTYSGLVALTVNYNVCIPPGDTRRFSLYRQLPDATLQLVGNANYNRRVTAVLDHFSVYIVGGN